MTETAKHEASHVVCARMLGRRVEYVEREVGFAWPGEQLGFARVPIGERLEVSQVVVCLVGYLSENRDNWPPPWPECLDEPLEGLGMVLVMLGVTEERYSELVDLARNMLVDSKFVQFRDSLARALTAVPRLEREDIEALASIYLPIKE
jgi:hypothetical protein